METTLTFSPTYFDVATEDPRLAGTLVDVDPDSGRATGIRRICLNEEDVKALVRSDQKSPNVDQRNM